MRLHLDRAPERIAHLGMNLFGTTTAEETIEGFERFFTGIGSPVRLSQYGLDTPENRAEIFRTLKANRAGGNHFRLSDQDYENLIQLMA